MRYFIKYTKDGNTATLCTSYSTEREAKMVKKMLEFHGYTIEIQERDVAEEPIVDYYHQLYKVRA